MDILSKEITILVKKKKKLIEQLVPTLQGNARILYKVTAHSIQMLWTSVPSRALVTLRYAVDYRSYMKGLDVA